MKTLQSVFSGGGGGGGGGGGWCNFKVFLEPILIRVNCKYLKSLNIFECIFMKDIKLSLSKGYMDLLSRPY